MITCPTCGALNDPVNRFCEQCGARLEPSGPVPSVAPPAATAQTCPNCGAHVLPGQAFCEECGTALTATPPPLSTGAPPVGFDAPTVMAPASAMPVAGSICPACGHQTMPGDRFCDSCGAALAPASSSSIADVPTAAAPEPLWTAPAPPVAPSAAGEPPMPTLIEAAPPLPAAPAALVEPPAPVVSEEVVAPVEAPPPSAPAAPALDAQAEYEAKRQALLDEIARQDQIIAQLEQMQATFGAATPHAITLALDEARNARAKAQKELDALQPPPPPVDPAVVAALNDEIARQQQIIAQLEQMQATFGAATPHAITLALDEARNALAKAQAELASLGVAAPAAIAPAPEAPPQIAAEPVVPPAPVVEPVAPPVAHRVEPVAPLPFAAPVTLDTAVTVTSPPAGPRLVFDNGQGEIAVPVDKAEITIGREDPISGIHPEIDLTPFGGESGGVSRQHARLIHSGGQWSIVDLGSTNYTRVDGLRIEPGAPHPLKDGARLQFGRLTVTFRM
ncbi:zinc-ribbon domain-containing protein [Roseiflexus castenholzii]|uniref:zinc-ribbon domain-containing protein n=1 Tax=Roseiflexus castenholzii TaxID=120962 RepID=UPI003C7E7F76